MGPWTASLLGMLQGLTEFLPVSSSGHLVAARALMGVRAPGASLEAWLHVGTALAVVVAYRRALCHLVRSCLARGERDGWRAFAALLLGSLPAAVAGLLLRAPLEAAFASPTVAAIGLLATTVCLASLSFLPAGGGPAGGAARAPAPAPWRAVAIGCAQALALVPGLSRSGSTIAAARWLGLGSEDAAAFSFLLSLPAVLGAAALEAAVHGALPVAPVPALVATAVSALSGLAALTAVRRLLAGGRLGLFAPYTLALALALLWRM